jgi:hypothetical protein
MKKILLLISFFAVFNLSKAQVYTFGAKGGLNQYTIGSLYQRPYNGESGINHKPNKDIGYQLGGFFNVKFGKFFIQPELNYVNSKNHYDLPKKKSYWKTSKMDIPILIGFEIAKPISVYIGPDFSFYNTTTLDGVQITSFSDGGPDLEKSTVSINFGIKASFGRFGLDLRYEAGQQNTQEELLDIIYSEYGTNLADLKSYSPHIISLSLYIDLISTDGEGFDSFFSNLFNGNKCWCAD